MVRAPWSYPGTSLPWWRSPSWSSMWLLQTISPSNLGPTSTSSSFVITTDTLAYYNYPIWGFMWPMAQASAPQPVAWWVSAAEVERNHDVPVLIETSFFSFFFLLSFLSLFLFICVYMDALPACVCVCWIAPEANRGPQIPWNES